MPPKEIPQFEVYRRKQPVRDSRARKQSEPAERLKLQTVSEVEQDEPVLARDFQALYEVHRKGVERKRENKRDVKTLAAIENRLIRLCVRNNPRNFDRSAVERIVNQYDQGVQRHFGTNFRFDSRELIDPSGVASVVAFIHSHQRMYPERNKESYEAPKRRLYLNDTLDANYKVDLIDFQYVPAADAVELQACELIQVKSSVEEARLEEERIREAHRAWYDDWTSTGELETQRAEAVRLPERLQPLEQQDVSIWAEQHGEVFDAMIDLDDALEHGDVGPEQLSHILHLTQKEQTRFSQYARYKKQELLALLSASLHLIETRTSPEGSGESSDAIRTRLEKAIELVAAALPNGRDILSVSDVYSVITVGDRVFSRTLIGSPISGKAVTTGTA
ncbi:MAG: hypothetical protein HY460_00680 [Parcubacteria group bacterium]|nr:hypothetical protein [Parcubacteria group bacterium]